MDELNNTEFTDIPELGGIVENKKSQAIRKTEIINASEIIEAEPVKDSESLRTPVTVLQAPKSAEEMRASMEAKHQEFMQLHNNQRLEQQRSSSCPVCGAKRERETHMRRFNDSIIDVLRNVTVASLDSCILCVQKHVSRAMVYYEEMLTATDSGTLDGTASVNVKMNHLKVLGHLGCAIEESTEYIDLNAMLIKHERAYRYEGISPDWPAIAAEIEKVENSLEKSN